MTTPRTIVRTGAALLTAIAAPLALGACASNDNSLLAGFHDARRSAWSPDGTHIAA